MPATLVRVSAVRKADKRFERAMTDSALRSLSHRYLLSNEVYFVGVSHCCYQSVLLKG